MLLNPNVIKAAYHALRSDEDGPLIFRDEHYDRMLLDIQRARDAEQDEIDERLNEDANGWMQ